MRDTVCPGSLAHYGDQKEMNAQKKILVLFASPKPGGNTASMVNWFIEGASSRGAQVETVITSTLKYNALGCTSCRQCQQSEKFECVINDGVTPVLRKMTEADVIVMATPLYFFSMSAQLKLVFDRMFSLYKWDNQAGIMRTPLKGKTLVLLASAFENVGLDALEKPFSLTADYTGMQFASLLIPDAGVSGDIAKKDDARKKAVELGERVA